MPKYRKKPVVIEATQFSATAPLPDGVIYDAKGFAVIPSEGVMLPVSEGDWIIKRANGRVYLCKPNIFAASYEAV